MGTTQSRVVYIAVGAVGAFRGLRSQEREWQ